MRYGASTSRRVRVVFGLATISWLSAAPTSAQVAVTGVAPAAIRSNAWGYLTVTGHDFTLATRALVNGVPLEQQVVWSTTRLTGLLNPATTPLPPGTAANLTVTDGPASDTLPAALSATDACAAPSPPSLSTVDAAASGSTIVRSLPYAFSCFGFARTLTPWIRLVQQTFTRISLCCGIYEYTFAVDPNRGLPRTGYVSFDNAIVAVHQAAAPGATDADANGLEDGWEARFGLAGRSQTTIGDADADGRSNIDEYTDGSHPLGLFRRYFAEGATGAFFDTVLALVAPTAAHVQARFLSTASPIVSHDLVLSPRTPVTLDVEAIPGLAAAEFGVVIESDTEIAAERTLRWDTSGFGSHAETAAPAAATRWYFAEGATHSGFDLFYTLLNPGAAAASVTCRFLRPDGTTHVVSIEVPAESRRTLWIDAVPGLDATDVAAVVEGSLPIVVERSMYLSSANQVFAAGHNVVGATAPASHWRFEEGATGRFFDTFLAVANPATEPAEIAVSYRPRLADALGRVGSAAPLVKRYTIPPMTRRTIWIDEESVEPLGRVLADVPFSMAVDATSGVPVVAERVMWWPGPTPATWSESHASFGATGTSSTWFVPAGDGDGATYVFVEGVGSGAMAPVEEAVLVDVLFEDGSSVGRVFAPFGDGDRLVIDILDVFPETHGRRWAVRVATPPLPAGHTPALGLVVEYSRYRDGRGVAWGAGENLRAGPVGAFTPFPP